MDWIPPLAHAIEIVGIGVILLGAFGSLGRFLRDLLRDRTGRSVPVFRRRLGVSILLGLEFLVAGDIINSVAIEPTLRSVASLGGIVLIRTFLSLSLHVEIEGHLP